MSATYQQVIAPWVGVGPSTSGSFTPNAAGDALLVFVADFNGAVSAVKATGTGSYSLISPPGQYNENNQLTSWALWANSSATAGSQTITTEDIGGPGDYIMGLGLDYSGVTAIAGAANQQASPGTGVGAIVGTSVSVPSGSVLVAMLMEFNSTATIPTNTAGTVRSSGQVPVFNWAYSVVEYAGAGSAIQPAFTDATNGGTKNYIVTQFLLTGAASSGTATIAWIT